MSKSEIQKELDASVAAIDLTKPKFDLEEIIEDALEVAFKKSIAAHFETGSGRNVVNQLVEESLSNLTTGD